MLDAATQPIRAGRWQEISHRRHRRGVWQLLRSAPGKHSAAVLLSSGQLRESPRTYFRTISDTLKTSNDNKVSLHHYVIDNTVQSVVVEEELLLVSAS